MRKNLSPIKCLTLLLPLFLFLSCSKEGKEKSGFDELTLARGRIVVKINATGTVKPENRLEVKAPIIGRVETILIREGALVKKGDTLALLSSTERAALLDAARSKGSEEYERWKTLYKETPLISPISGTVILRNVEEGQNFGSNDALFVLSNRLTVKAMVDETDIAKIKKGIKATILLDAYDKESIDGIVVSVAFDATISSGVTTYEVDVAPTKTPPFMRSGMTANVYFILDEIDDVTVVPSNAITFDKELSTVLVKNNDGKASKCEVKLGHSDGKVYELLTSTCDLKDGTTLLIKKLSAKSNFSNPLSPMGPRSNQKKR